MGSPLTRYNLGLFNSGIYTPGNNNVIAVTQSNPATVTTSLPHNYVFGQQVQFLIPPQWGMRQLNMLTGYVLSVPTPTTFTVNIDTTLFDAFVVPTQHPPAVIQSAQVAAIGDFNSGTLAPGGVLPLPQTIPGAYINTPPN
jgi:hypothetical protein